MKEAARKEGTVRELPVSEVPTCPILGVRIAAIDMKAALAYIQEHLRELSGNYICISNVHTTVTSYEDAEYRKIQNGGAPGPAGWEAPVGAVPEARLRRSGSGDRPGSDA